MIRFLKKSVTVSVKMKTTIRDIIQLQKTYAKDTELAAALGINPTSLYVYRRRYGIKRPPRIEEDKHPTLFSRLTAMEKDLILRDHQGGMRVYQIAAKYKCSPSTVYRILGTRISKKPQYLTKDRLLRLQFKFSSDAAIARHLGVSSQFIRTRRKRFNLWR